VVVLSYQYLHVFEWPAQGENFLAGRSHRTLIEGRQCEGVCFDAQRVLFTNEQREIYCLPASSLWTLDRFVPEPPLVGAPRVEPRVDGTAAEWPRDRRAGRLVFGHFVDQGSADGAEARAGKSSPAAAADSVRVRVGWSARGLLVHASWLVQDWTAAQQAGEPLAYFMIGPDGGDRPCLEPAAQSIWSATPDGDSLQVGAAAPEPGQTPCEGAVRTASQTRLPASATRRHGRRVDLEVLLPLAEPLAPGSVLRFDVALRQNAGGRNAEFGWSASLDMQPLGNPLLWGKIRLDPPRGRAGGG